MYFCMAFEILRYKNGRTEEYLICLFYQWAWYSEFCISRNFLVWRSKQPTQIFVMIYPIFLFPTYFVGKFFREFSY